MALTTGIDSSTAAQTVNGVIDTAGATSARTFQTGDSISNAKNLNLTVTGTDTSVATLKNVEAVNVKHIAGAASFNAANWENVGAVNVTNTTDAAGVVTVTNGEVGTVYGVKGSAVVGTNTTLNVGIRAADAVGTDTTVKFAVSNAGAAANAAMSVPAVNVNLNSTSAGVEKVSVATEGSNVFTVNGGAAKELLITGAGDNTITVGTLATTSTIDASAATGKQDINLGTSLTAGDKVMGGAGSEDVVRATLSGLQNNVEISGVETLRLNAGSNGTVLFKGDTAFDSIRVSEGNVNSSLRNVKMVESVDFVGAGTTASATAGSNFGAFALNGSLPGSADTLAVNINNGGVAKTGAGAFTVGNLTLDGAETVNVTVADASATSGLTTIGTGIGNAISSTTLQSLSFTTEGALTLGGSIATTGATATLSSLDFTGVKGAVALGTQTVAFADGAVIQAGAGGTTAVFSGVASGRVVSFNGGAGVDNVSFAGSTGQAIVNGGAGNDIIIGGAGNDILNGGAGDDTITGGAGADTMTGGAGADTFVIGNADSGITIATADRITDFVAGTDKLSLGAAASGTNFATGTAVADFAAALVAANAAFTADAGGAKEYFVTNDGTDTYVFIDNGADGAAAEQVIVLTGVVAVTATDIIA